MKNLSNRFTKVAIFLASITSSSLALSADQPNEKAIKAAVLSNTNGKVILSSVFASPIPGIYEVTSGVDVFYVDSTGRYGFVDGRLVDMKMQKDLTATRLEKVSAIQFNDLPLDLAIKSVHGNGKRKLAVFEDPACPVCKALHKFISQIPNATIYTFMYPVVSPDSIPKAQAAWCSGNRAEAWSNLLQGGSAPENVVPCDTTGLGQIASLGDKLSIAGTPTVFLQNGRRLVGATPPDQMLAAISDAEQH